MKISGDIIELETVSEVNFRGDKTTKLRLSVAHSACAIIFYNDTQTMKSKPGKMSEQEKMCCIDVLDRLIQDAELLKKRLKKV